MVVWGGTTTTVQVSIIPQSVGVNVPGTEYVLSGWVVMVVV